MDMYAEILTKALEGGKIEVTFPDMKISPEDIIEGRCYAALSKIKDIIDDPSLNDCDCFQKIEEIICTLEFLGVSNGGRHDFG